MPKSKSFSFTYSKLKNYETCGLQHQQVDILRQPGLQPSGDAIDYGNRVHDCFKKALKDGEPLQPRMRHLQYWVDWINSLPGEKHIENKWGLTRDYQPIDFFSAMAWMRFIADAAIINGRVGLLVDWKTGKRLEEPLQLWLGAACMFQYFPELQVVDSMFVWLKEDDGRNSAECITAETVKRGQIGDIWDQLLPRIQGYEDAVATGTFFPKPGFHCKWCRVQACEYFGKAQ
jgi:hypothetical protein